MLLATLYEMDCHRLQIWIGIAVTVVYEKHLYCIWTEFGNMMPNVEETTSLFISFIQLQLATVSSWTLVEPWLCFAVRHLLFTKSANTLSIECKMLPHITFSVLTGFQRLHQGGVALIISQCFSARRRQTTFCTFVSDRVSLASASVQRVWPDHEVGPGPPGRAGEEGQQVAHPQPLEEGPVVLSVRHQT